MSIAVDYDRNTDGLQDYKEALKWYKQALELDEENIDSAYCIGLIYYNAKGIKSDWKLALHYFKLTVSLDERDSHEIHKNAYFFMGEIYEHGEDGVPQNYILAHEYFEKAFDCGEVKAAVALMKLYRDGLGVRKDNNKVKEWMQRAISASPKAKLEQISPRLFRVIR
ncbi:hypothetical protein BDF21DRAFT_456118 [Thamnidium elegans]|uniref:Beta-lactamase n=1 Tax=Thamnidium elegans TaxID=101142 RepID=A0A8H7SEJ2_9FUNG|nr:hypothetical protein INT48_004924 [Thamnidium elegans]KAI8057455.1 hypothetical protein BDF21DRAFT_456118 [Thamnidium elegans]